MWNPTDRNGQMLQCGWIHGNSQDTVLVISGFNPPRDERHPTARPADTKVVSNTFEPSTKAALKYPSAEVVDLIYRIFTRPRLDGVLCTKGMALLEVAWHSDCVPDPLGRRGDLPRNSDWPPEPRLRIFPFIVHVFFHTTA